MDAASTLLIILAVLMAMVMGVVLAVTVSIFFASRQIKSRVDDLDEHLVRLIQTIEKLDTSSTTELNALHESLVEQQRVHKTLTSSSRIFNMVFRKPAVIVGATKVTKLTRSNKKRGGSVLPEQARARTDPNNVKKETNV